MSIPVKIDVAKSIKKVLSINTAKDIVKVIKVDPLVAEESNTGVYTVIPEFTEANYTSSIEFLKAYTSYLDNLTDFTSHIDRYIQYNRALNSSDFVNSTADIFTNINSNVYSIDNQFLIPWIKKYNQSVDEVKKVVELALASNNIYEKFSDSIGLYANTGYLLTDSVIPFNDINCALYQPPKTYPATLANKLSPASIAVADKLSRLTTTMFRQNVINIQKAYATSTEAHGSNLITDIQSYSLARNYIEGIVNKLDDEFQAVFKLVTYVSNINDHTGFNSRDYEVNTAAVGRYQFTIKVQGNPVLVDLLGKKLKIARSSLTIAKSLVSGNAVPVVSINQKNINTQYTAKTVTNVRSGKVIPINTSALLSEGTIKPSILPEPAVVPPEQAAKGKAMVSAQAKTSVTAKPVGIKGLLGFVGMISKAVPEFSRINFAQAIQSPLGTARKIRDLVCKAIDFAKTFELGKLAQIQWPPVWPPFFKNFKIKKLLAKLALEVQIRIIKFILSLIPKIPDIAAIIKAIKKKIQKLAQEIRDLFTCNPGTKIRIPLPVQK